MSEKLLTHKDLAKLLGVSETTVKSYRRKFPNCIPVANNGKPIRFTDQAAQVALKIRDLFATGMSVEEVRLRLCEEFSWIQPETKEVDKKPVRSGAEISSELSTGVSNMARSMVVMAQQQKAILNRMQGIESILEDLGINIDTENLDEQKKKHKQQAEEKQARIEERLNNLDETAHTLMQSIGNVANQLEEFFASRGKAKEKWQQGLAEQNTTRSTTLKFVKPESSPSLANIQRSNEQTPPATGEAYAQNFPTAMMDADTGVSAEPPRSFFNTPLVVRNAQGHYISAGGRSRGRFSLNDLKAMLVYGFAPPLHYVLSWKAHGQGWALSLQQPEKSDGEHVEFLLMEVPTQRGDFVVDILQIKRNGEKVHPAEISALLDSIIP